MKRGMGYFGFEANTRSIGHACLAWPITHKPLSRLYYLQLLGGALGISLNLTPNVVGCACSMLGRTYLKP